MKASLDCFWIDRRSAARRLWLEERSALGADGAGRAAPAQPKLGIRPDGDTKVSIDLSKITSDELKKVFGYIDAHIDDHVINLQKWIQQPSASRTPAKACRSPPRW